MDPVPTEDISAFTSEVDAELRQRTGRDFAQKWAFNGCLATVGYGVSLEFAWKSFRRLKTAF